MKDAFGNGTAVTIHEVVTIGDRGQDYHLPPLETRELSKRISNYLYNLKIKMNKILKDAYTKFWVPVMGRFVSKLIPWLEGKPPEKPPTYDIDGDNGN